MILPFTFASTPRIHFGVGIVERLGELMRSRGARRILLITGGSSLDKSGRLAQVTALLVEHGLNVDCARVTGEPSPGLVDQIAAPRRAAGIDSVVAIGGGSVIDAGKAISAALPVADSIAHYLEGVGDRQHPGTKVPFVAVPTTAGTGSEATKNAVLSRVGPDGYKKSLRHDSFVPDLALIDPQLAVTCPPDLTAACGMDAFTQLLESYVSTKASPFTDSLALEGLRLLGHSIAAACTSGRHDAAVRGDMACAALLSGITLANAGLGVVHGFASALGGRFALPHGVVCGTLVGAATRAVIDRLASDPQANRPALDRYARAGEAVAGTAADTWKDGCRLLTRQIDRWIETLGIPTLGRYGVSSESVEEIAAQTADKNSPAPLDTATKAAILRERL